VKAGDDELEARWQRVWQASRANSSIGRVLVGHDFERSSTGDGVECRGCGFYKLRGDIRPDPLCPRPKATLRLIQGGKARP
jgi:hypothetical protein